MIVVAAAVVLAASLWATVECMGQPERAGTDFLVRLVDCS